MNTYNVVVDYQRASGVLMEQPFTVEAHTRPQAKKSARRLFHEDHRRRSSTILGVRVEKPWSEPVLPEPIQNGEFIRISRKPIEGKVELLQNGFVAVHKPNGGKVICSRAQVEEATGRPVAPRPPKVTTEVLVLYPNGNVYQQTQPIQNSSHGVENLVQVKITKQDGVIVNKEFV